MSTPPLTLRTLDSPGLEGPDGPISLADPRAFALLVMLALAGDEGIAEDEALLRLTPSLTPARGRGVLNEIIDTLARLGESGVRREGTRIRIAPGLVTLDVHLVHGQTRGAAGPRLLRGFELPDSPEFSQWLQEARLQVAPVSFARHPFAPRAVGVALAVVAAIGVLLWRVVVSRAADAELPPGALVVLADVENATGDTLFDASLTLAAAVSLQQSARIGLLPRSRITAALARAGILGGDTLLNLQRAREAAVREGVRFVIAPRIAAEGNGYRLSAVLLDAATDRLTKETSALAEGRAGVLPALDQVLREVRMSLGDARRAPDAPMVGLPELTTPSLEALRSYAMGAQAWAESDYELAEELWHRAIDQDTGFAMAMGSLGSVKAYRHDRDSTRYFFARALARSSRLTEWERMHLEDSWAAARGDLDSAVVLSRRIAERFPHATSWYNYGTSLMQDRRCEEAVRAFRRALELDPRSYTTHINLATCSRRLNRSREALEHYEQGAAVLPSALLRGNVAFEFAMTLTDLGLRDSAARHLERLLNQTGLFERTLGHRGLGYLALAEGRFGEAEQQFEATVVIARQQKSPLGLVRGLLLLGLARLTASDSDAAGLAFQEMSAVIDSESIVPPMLALAGWGLARSGHEAEAALVRARLRHGLDSANVEDRASEQLLAGVIALTNGAAASAQAALSAASAFPQPALVALLRASALETMGKPDSAAALRKMVSYLEVFGTETYFEWLRQGGRR